MNLLVQTVAGNAEVLNSFDYAVAGGVLGPVSECVGGIDGTIETVGDSVRS
jgi:hypothetical protein